MMEAGSTRDRVRAAVLLLRKTPLFSTPTAAIVWPLFLGTVLNGLVRPWLAERLGGTVVRSGSGVRGGDRWWTFDVSTQAEHPMLTGFLATSDGTFGMILLAMIAVLLIGRWSAGRLRAGKRRAG